MVGGQTIGHNILKARPDQCGCFAATLPPTPTPPAAHVHFSQSPQSPSGLTRRSLASLTPKKGGWGSELERPLLIKAQCQDRKQKSRFQNAEPTQQVFGETAPEHLSSAAELRAQLGLIRPRSGKRLWLRAGWHAATS